MKKSVYLLVLIFTMLLSGCGSKEITLADYEAIEIGTDQKKIHKEFGDPAGSLSGLYGDIYVIDDMQVIIYYQFVIEGDIPVTEV